VIEVNTPGGSITSLLNIMSAELTSTVRSSPTSRLRRLRGSAGALVTLGAPWAMAPSTVIGASSRSTVTAATGTTEQAKVESVLVTQVTQVRRATSAMLDLATKMITNALRMERRRR